MISSINTLSINFSDNTEIWSVTGFGNILNSEFNSVNPASKPLYWSRYSMEVAVSVPKIVEVLILGKLQLNLRKLVVLIIIMIMK